MAACASRAPRPRRRPNPGSASADNSFLVEEAFNQEHGVVQNIFRRHANPTCRLGRLVHTGMAGPGACGISSRTPCRSRSSAGPPGGAIILINYRFQVLERRTDQRPAFAPRLSDIVPSSRRPALRWTPEARAGRSTCRSASASAVCTCTECGRVRGLRAERSTATSRHRGSARPVRRPGAAIWAVRPMFQVMLESCTCSRTLVDIGGREEHFHDRRRASATGWNFGETQVVVGSACR